MANQTILLVKILGDSADAQQAIRQTEVAIESADNTTKKSGKNMVGVWAAVGASMLAVVRSSAMLESATHAVNTVFGDQADEMITWAEGMAEYGLSTAQAAQAAAVLGAQLKNAGFTAEEMTVITQGLIETSAQLATVMGVDTVDAVAAMGAALRGEYDSLESLGITLTADAVAAEQMRLATEGLTFASEQQAKAVATLSLIQQGATTILGEGEEQVITMNSATNHLRASVQNLTAAIGGALTPALGPLIEGVATVTDKIGAQIAESEALAAISETLGQIILSVAEILDPVLSQALSLVSSLLDALWALIGPILVPALEALERVLSLVADALSVVIGWVESAIDAFERFISIVHEAIDSLSFWNDTYQASAPPTALAYRAAPGIAAFGRMPSLNAGTTVNVNISAGMIADPHGLAREIRKVLSRDTVRMGRLNAGIAK